MHLFDIDTVAEALLETVSFRQVEDGCSQKLHPDLIGGSVFVEAVRAASPFLKGEYLSAVLEELSPVKLDTVPVWDETVPYSQGVRVSHEGNVYVSLQDGNTGEMPAWDSAWWETALSAALRRQYHDAVSECVSHLITAQMSRARIKSQRFMQPLFKQISDGVLEEPVDSFVAVSFDLPAELDRRVDIVRIGLRSSVAQEIPFYLYHSSQQEPVAEHTVGIEPGEENRWVWKQLPAAFKMSWLPDGNAGGRYWLGYYEDELAGGLYTHRTAFFLPRCCPGLRYRPCVFSAAELDPPSLPGPGFWLDGGAFTDSTAFNVEAGSVPDYTYKLIGNIQALAKAVQHDLAVRLLEAGRNSTRLNRDKHNLVANIANVLDDRVVNSNGYPKTEKGLVSTAEDYRSQVRIDLLPKREIFKTSFS